jgi:hypothetical protein
MPPIADFGRPSTPPAPQMEAPHQPGEFTQLFQRLSPTIGAPAPTPTPMPPMPAFVPDSMRSLEAPRADFLPPPVLPQAPSLTPPPVPAPSFGLPAPSLGAAPLPQPPSPALPPWGGASNGTPNAGGVFGVGMQSEFTRILGRVATPPPPPPIQAPAAAPASTPQKPAKSMVPLIIALNLVVLLTIAIVVYFVLRK